MTQEVRKLSPITTNANYEEYLEFLTNEDSKVSNSTFVSFKTLQNEIDKECQKCKKPNFIGFKGCVNKRYVKIIATFVLIILNSYSIFKELFDIKEILKRLTHNHMAFTIITVEAIIMFLLLMLIIILPIKMYCVKKQSQFQTQKIVNSIRYLQSFSCFQLVKLINIDNLLWKFNGIGNQLNLCLYNKTKYASFISTLISSIICIGGIILGIMASVVKLEIASVYMNKSFFGGKNQFQNVDQIVLLGIINQIAGLSNPFKAKMQAKNDMIFQGEDSILSKDELIRKNVIYDLIYQKILKTYKFKGFLFLITINDIDLQWMFLEDNNKHVITDNNHYCNTHYQELVSDNTKKQITINYN